VPAKSGPAESQAVPVGSIGVRSHTSWVDGDDLFIAGDVENLTSVRYRFVEVIATFYDASGQVLGTDFTYTDLSTVAAGNVAPFLIWTDVLVGYSHYSLELDPLAGAPSPVGAVTIIEGVHYTDSFGSRHFVGQVHNPNGFVVEFAEVIVTLLDGNGAVINTDFTFTNPHTIGAGGTAPFDLIVRDHHAGAVSYRLQVDAWRQGDLADVFSWDNYFDDVHSSAFRSDIAWVGNAGITFGCGVAAYCPSAAVTREQMASFIARARNLPQPTADYFVDDEHSVFHENDINRMREANITTGCGTDPVVASPTFGHPIYCPSQPVTRAQMASFLSRALALPEPSADYFVDDEGSVFHENDINKMYEAGITLGCGGPNYCPDQPVTREQMAAFLHRALD
jgi:S-layer homology domain